MKKILVITLFLFGVSIYAQRHIEKTVDYNNQEIDIEVPFAFNITVKNWDKSTIQLEADLTMDEEEFLDLYELNITEQKSLITIESNAKPVFKAFQEKYGEKRSEDGKTIYVNCCHIEYEFNYTLYIPKNANFKISSINGSITSKSIEGDFTADLINGDINIADYKGKMDLSTINGEIDLKLINTSIVAETIHGNIYADEAIKLTSEDRMIGQKVKGETKNPLNTLKLKTINGNLYLRI
ncbi:hypothetical protein OOZ15_03840 [Galbibacter sp. EGI 63066]|uniref:hypothetical protein n=1 Tax=Galbibacter sp. EGI 63066 TaxID=2993559 RepID=UPI002248D26F|nr:hypothetical protein [Galbibacter sp. EGI 63066]MCX2679063.1 hypothetical protein [Galbibacter sp. EGI 63066]